MYQAHELANLFPMIEGQDITDLVADIQAHGLRDPITLFENKVLDGRNRQAACSVAGVEPRYEPLPAGVDPLAFVVSKNLKRRHLTPVQLAALANTIANMPLGGAVYRSAPGPTENRVSQEKAAEMTGASTRTMRRLKAIQKEDPALHDKVVSGKVSQKGAEVRVRAKPAPKPAPEPKPHKATKLGEIADKIVSKMDAEGVTEVPPGKEIAKEFGNICDREANFVADQVRTVLRDRAARSEVEPVVDPTTLPKTWAEKYEIALRKAVKDLQAQFDAAVSARAKELIDQHMLPGWQKKIAYAEEMERSWRKDTYAMTRDEYKKVRNCLHPDRVTDAALKARYSEAFDIFVQLEDKLVMPEAPKDETPAMPSSFDEIIKTRPGKPTGK